MQLTKFFNIKNKKKFSENPYVKGASGRKEWNDRYINMRDTIKKWQTAFFSAVGIIFILILGITKIATESRVTPFVVETNNSMPVAIKPMKSISLKDQRLINFAINQFIINARTIINDTDAEKELLNKLYAYSANDTINFLHDYYSKNNPFNLVSQYTVTVNIINSLPMSKDTWQITWDETKHATNGNTTLGVSRWVANVTYKIGEVNPHFINENPFGLYVTQVSWSENQS